MSDFILEILEPIVHKIEIETSFLSNLANNTIEIERYDNVNIEIVNTEKVLASDLPDDIPMSKIIGNLSYTRIDGLTEYVESLIGSGVYNIHVDDLLWGDGNVGLSGYLNQYNFDCGTL